MTSTSLGTFGESFTSRNPSKTSKSGRICEQKGCDTVLSIYNKDELCALHVGPQKMRIRGR